MANRTRSVDDKRLAAAGRRVATGRALYAVVLIISAAMRPAAVMADPVVKCLQQPRSSGVTRDSGIRRTGDGVNGITLDRATGQARYLQGGFTTLGVLTP